MGAFSAFVMIGIAGAGRIIKTASLPPMPRCRSGLTTFSAYDLFQSCSEPPSSIDPLKQVTLAKPFLQYDLQQTVNAALEDPKTRRVVRFAEGDRPEHSFQTSVISGRVYRTARRHMNGEESPAGRNATHSVSIERRQISRKMMTPIIGPRIGT
jgi:hypothetical protein